MPRPATEADLDAIAMALPGVASCGDHQPGYSVRGKPFVAYRGPRPDAVDETGQRLTDVIIIWVESQTAKLALLADENLPLFTTDHFDGHPSVLLRASRMGEMSVAELTELIQESWLARAPKRVAREWLNDHQAPEDS